MKSHIARLAAKAIGKNLLVRPRASLSDACLDRYSFECDESLKDP
jgi:hypothetical protein